MNVLISTILTILFFNLKKKTIQQLRTISEVREKVQQIMFGKLPALCQVLVAFGGVGSFDTDPALLQPLWTVIAGCMELGSGKTDFILSLLFTIAANACLPTSFQYVTQQYYNRC